MNGSLTSLVRLTHLHLRQVIPGNQLVIQDRESVGNLYCRFCPKILIPHSHRQPMADHLHGPVFLLFLHSLGTPKIPLLNSTILPYENPLIRNQSCQYLYVAPNTQKHVLPVTRVVTLDRNPEACSRKKSSHSIEPVRATETKKQRSTQQRLDIKIQYQDHSIPRYLDTTIKIQ